MSHSLHILGIRHHGPGSARMTLRALDIVNPDCVLIEGPPDAGDIVRLAAHEQMQPPVALLIYDPAKPRHAAIFPFAVFSPEWQALRWACGRGVVVRLIDAPASLRPPRDGAFDQVATDNETGDSSDVDKPVARRGDPLSALAKAAGYADDEAWWGKLIEERGGEENPLEVFAAISEAMQSARASMGTTPYEPDEPMREAHMRRAIRIARKEGHERIAVVCGAWHAPVLTESALEEFTSKADDDLLKALSRRKPAAATWIPWTYDRLCFDSGYGAGIASPGWYEHLWTHREQGPARWLTRVSRLMREEGLDASPASVIEAVRLADSLASVRGRAMTGLDELSDATLAVLCHANPLPMEVIRRKLVVSDRLGQVPDEAPTVPFQRDLAALQKSLRMTVSAESVVLELDQRKEIDLARSRLLHRLLIVGIPWGEQVEAQRRSAGTFRETWRLEWLPEFGVSIIEAARWGNTVEDAAGAFVRRRAGKAKELVELTGLLDHVMLADLPEAVKALVQRIQDFSAVSETFGGLMDALPPLGRILRYGNVRKTDAKLVEPLLESLLARICAGLTAACASLDDDAAARMRKRVDIVSTALATLGRADLLEAWHAQLRSLTEAEVHGLVAGRAWRILVDAHACTPEAAATRLSLALSLGGDPAAASAWIDGFVSGSGEILVHDDRLRALMDGWVCSLPHEAFEQVCPIVRRTFATFEAPTRRIIGQRLAREIEQFTPKSSRIDGYNPERGALVDPVLGLILGEVVQ